jgi:outer membrane protein
MKLFKYIFLSIFILIVQHTSFSQNPTVWSLQQMIEISLKNNLDIKQNQLTQQTQENSLQQSRLNNLPSINGSLSNLYNIGRRIDPFTNQFADNTVRSDNLNLSSNVNLFNGLQQYNTIKQNELNVMAAKKDIENNINTIVVTVSQTYIQALLANEQEKVAKRQLDITLAQRNRTQKLVDAGTAAKATLFDLDAQIAQEELQIVNAQIQYRMALLNLVLLLDLKTVENFEIEIPTLADLTSTMNYSAEEVYQQALQKQASLQAQNFRIESAKKGIDIAKGAILPSLSFFASIGSGYSGLSKQAISFEPKQYIIGRTISGEDVYTQTIEATSFEKTPYRQQLDLNLNKSFGFQLSVPIFNGWQIKTNITRSKIQLEREKNSLEIIKRDLKRTVYQAYYDADAAMKKYTASKKTLEAQTLSTQNVESRFELGVVNTFEFNDAKNRLNKSNSDLLQAKYDYVFKLKLLEFYATNSIKL